MPPNSTQNLNAKLSALNGGHHGSASSATSIRRSPIQTSGPPVRIVGAPVPYRGGYHLSF